MKKFMIVFLSIILLLSPLIGGCSQTKEASKYTESEQQLEGMYEACRQIKIVDGGAALGPIEVDTLPSLGETTVEAVLTRSNGMEMQGNWTGTPLSAVFAHYGVQVPFKELKIQAWDGYVGRMDYETSMLPDTILARLENGKKIQEVDGPVRLVVGSKDGFFWVRMVTEIEVLR
ncbi:MAG: molybdopterin-dependent oxidoreductase [Actinobacteria bacterium]|nr:molybdopterin-dependent oxidoreductase [Actinomycetota bacterium]